MQDEANEQPAWDYSERVAPEFDLAYPDILVDIPALVSRVFQHTAGQTSVLQPHRASYLCQPTFQTNVSFSSLKGHGDESYVLPDHAVGSAHTITAPYSKIAPASSSMFSSNSLNDPGASSGFGSSTTSPERYVVGRPFPEHFKQAHPCADCGNTFGTLLSLSKHASKDVHQAFKCKVADCEGAFSRVDALVRHGLHDHTESAPRYSYPHCKKYQGQQGFKRKDHLTQHLRGYHDLDPEHESRQRLMSYPHKDCTHYVPDGYDRHGVLNDHVKLSPDDARVFKSSSEYQKHMRKAHDETPFQCSAPTCTRTGAKGYFRLRDLQKHQRKEHNDDFEHLSRTEEQWVLATARYFWHLVVIYRWGDTKWPQIPNYVELYAPEDAGQQ